MVFMIVRTLPGQTHTSTPGRPSNAAAALKTKTRIYPESLECVSDILDANSTVHGAVILLHLAAG